MTRGGTSFEAVDVETGIVLSRHRDRDSAGQMWAVEISSGEVEVIDLADRSPSVEREPAD